MKAVRATKGRPLGPCRHCHREVRIGQVGLVSNMPNNPITDREYVVHVKCMAMLVASAPRDQDEEAFHDLREKILATGEAFPD